MTAPSSMGAVVGSRGGSAAGSERVIPSDIEVAWSAGAPEAVLLTREGSAQLAARLDDDDGRCVVLRWNDVRFASMGSPNDEALPGHRLYAKGLCDVLWLGVVENSALIADIERAGRCHPYHDPARFASLTHYSAPMKEGVVEVVAGGLQVEWSKGSPLEALLATERPH